MVEFIGDDEDLHRIFEAMSSTHDFYVFTNTQNIGITDNDQSLENLGIIIQRARAAYESGFYIEFISLKLQFIEFFLRIYCVLKTQEGQIYTPDDRKTFGVIVNQCKQNGFREDLIEQLKEFNEGRINAIHKFLLGDTSESKLRQIAEKFRTLGNIVKEYVVTEVGIRIINKEDFPTEIGSMLFQVQKTK